MTALDHARQLTDGGLRVLPIPPRAKAPAIAGWQTLRLTGDQLAGAFGVPDSNIGTLLGEPSGWVIDIDLDSDDARRLADDFLPPTPATFGRAGAPRSHRLYRLTSPAPTRKFLAPDGSMILELRSTGCQTVAPGSVHPTGERIVWMAPDGSTLNEWPGDPAPINPEELRVNLEALATACGWQAKPAKGGGAPKAPPAAPMAPAGSTTVYGARVLEAECGDVASTAEGGRNHRLNTAAFKIGQLIPHEIERSDAERLLIAAARQCGLGDAEAFATIRSGLDGGAKYPREKAERVVDTFGVDLSYLDGAPTKPTTSTTPTDAATPPARAGLSFKRTTLRQLRHDHPRLETPIIDGMLRQGEVMNLIAAPKCGKSWIVHALACAAAGGCRWLGRDVQPGRVLLLDGELTRAVLGHRLSAVEDALGVDAGDGIDLWPFRDRRAGFDAVLDAIKRHTDPGEYALVIVDPVFSFYPDGHEENDNAATARLYGMFAELGAHTRAGIVCVHHSSKGGQGEKNITDVGAGAGAVSRAADAHAVLRPHEEDDAIVLDAVVRSFPPVAPIALRRQHPLWVPARDLDPEALRQTGRRKREAAPKPKPREWTVAEFVGEFVAHEWRTRAEIEQLAVDRGLKRTNAERLLKLAEADRLVIRATLDGRSPPVFGRAELKPQPPQTGGAF